MTNWTELKRLAEEATGGDWYAGNAYDKRFIAAYQVIVKIEEGNYVILEGNQNFLEDARRNVAYVAAANPKTILALIAENEKLSEECEGCPMADAERLREERDSQQRVCIKIMEERDQLRVEVEALCRQVETLTEWYANGLNAIQSLRTLLSAAISLDHHHAITDRTYPLRQDIDAALGRDQA